ncbi:hypothetical protein [Kitasatospora sp. KL5]|uniref:hypothetical protein n=1 Tax=Kitasatospora sp. KL5 TaxID=3425125 RepID=UPI003D6FC468
MSRPVRWVVTVGSAVVAFVVCLWLARSASFGWLPKAEADRWVVATAFATVGAGAVATAVGRWAGQTTTPTPAPPAPSPPTGQEVIQTAEASGRSRINQVGGNQTMAVPATPADPGVPRTVRQDATAMDDGQVDQVAGHQHTEPPKP